MHIPLVTSELLTTLRKLYPDRLARSAQSDFDQGIAVGRQQIIDKLKQIHDKEATNVRPKS